MEPLPDGFLKLADELSRRAASEPDPTMKAQLLQTAERYRRMDEQARTVLTEAATLQAKVRAPARHPVAQSVLYIVFTGFFWVLAFLHEFDTASVALATALSALFALVWYFESRDTAQPPSRTETALAWAWLGFRSLVGIVAALLFLGLPIAALVVKEVEFHDGNTPVALLVGCAIGVLCLWVGLFGWRRNIRRDVTDSSKQKRRYGWPF